MIDGVTRALQVYADRGVFRGFQATPRPRGRAEYQFHWLLRARMRAVADAHKGTLTFESLFPGIGRATPVAVILDAVVASRTDRTQPAHKRLDARRARVAGRVTRGDWSLIVTIRGANYQYAVQRALNLVNELFLSLHEAEPEYLIERFGLSPE